MDRSIGVAHYASNVHGLARPLLLMGEAYKTPVYFYNASHIDLTKENPTVPATFWNGSSLETKEIEVPLFTENMLFREGKIDSRFVSDEINSWLASNTRMVDHIGINKAHLPQILINSPFAECAIPTYMVTSYEQLLTLSRLIPKSIIKPSAGRRGIAVWHLNLVDGVLMMQENETVQPVTPEKWASYTAFLAQHHFGKPILQPRLNLTLDEEHALDFRLLVARGGTGDWETVAIYARVGATSLVSNLSRGGYICDAPDALRMIAGDRAESLMETLRTLAVELPRLLQSYRKKPFSCLGLDVGIDRDTLQPFFLEANSSPGTKYHLWPLAEKRVQYYRYLLSQL